MEKLDYIITTPVFKREGVMPKIVCKDGATLSVQASRFHYCDPRDDTGPWHKVEVGYPSVQPPESWFEYAEELPNYTELWGQLWLWFKYCFKRKNWHMFKATIRKYFTEYGTQTIYPYIPVELVREFIAAHGGEQINDEFSDTINKEQTNGV